MEIPVSFQCGNENLIGIFCEGVSDTAVLIVVGGPQYRVGSHRQFTFLARYLAEQGIPSLRFDYRGMGDSSGKVCGFENVQIDIAAAVDQTFQLSSGLKRVVLWGLCDAASANLFYAYTDERVSGLVMLNPWVRTIEGEAKAYLKHYYKYRLLDKTLWKKIFTGHFDFRKSIESLFSKFLKLRVNTSIGSQSKNNEMVGRALPERMLQGLKQFDGDVLLILSGDDLVAEEFRDLVASSADWEQVLAGEKFTQYTLKEANHTFSSKVWRGQVERWTSEWIATLDPTK